MDETACRDEQTHYRKSVTGRVFIFNKEMVIRLFKQACTNKEIKTKATSSAP